jgi:hypothetical protein
MRGINPIRLMRWRIGWWARIRHETVFQYVGQNGIQTCHDKPCDYNKTSKPLRALRALHYQRNHTIAYIYILAKL